MFLPFDFASEALRVEAAPQDNLSSRNEDQLLTSPEEINQYPSFQPTNSKNKGRAAVITSTPLKQQLQENQNQGKENGQHAAKKSATKRKLTFVTSVLPPIAKGLMGQLR